MKNVSFYWVFRNWLDRFNPYAFSDKMGVSEKTVYSWSVPPTSNFHRQNPLDKAKQVTDLLNERAPDILFEYLHHIASEYGYDIVKKQNQEHYTISQTHKELCDVTQCLLEAFEDGKITKEEAEKVEKEIIEALYVLNEKLSEFKEIQK